MQFNSYVFILAFLPLQVLGYFLANKLNHGLGKAALVIGSVVFYAYAGIWPLQVLLLSAGVNYLFALAIKKLKWKRLFLFIPILVNIGLLFYFKYTNFAIANINEWFGRGLAFKTIAQPLGISFFTFQQIAYLVSVCKGEVTTSLLDYLAFIMYFPKIIMGPLAEPADFFGQLNRPELKKADWNNMARGVKLFSFGLFKKMLLADYFSAAVSWGFNSMGVATSMDWILVALFYTFEIYFDFSGYSDMATGASLMLNITLPINFNSPYKALSIRDFWKRWHISLTGFFTKYVYIPLGGNRRGAFFTAVNTMAVFLLSGIWHGASWTFVLWGALHGLLSLFDRMAEKWQNKIFEPARWLVTFGATNVLWLLFRSPSIRQWKDILGTVAFMQNTAVSEGLLNVFALPEQAFLLKIMPFLSIADKVRGFWMVLFTLGAFFICLVPENNYINKEKLTWLSLILAAVAFIWALTCLGSESVFVYFNF